MTDPGSVWLRQTHLHFEETVLPQQNPEKSIAQPEPVIPI